MIVSDSSWTKWIILIAIFNFTSQPTGHQDPFESNFIKFAGNCKIRSLELTTHASSAPSHRSRYQIRLCYAVVCVYYTLEKCENILHRYTTENFAKTHLTFAILRNCFHHRTTYLVKCVLSSREYFSRLNSFAEYIVTGSVYRMTLLRRGEIL